MGAELIGTIECDQCGDCDKTAIPFGELGTFPDIPEQHVIRQLGQLGIYVSHQLLGARQLLCASRMLRSWRVGLSLDHGGGTSGEDEARGDEQVFDELL